MCVTSVSVTRPHLTPPVLIMATAGDSWYLALLGLADSFKQANNIKVRIKRSGDCREWTYNAMLGVCPLSHCSLQLQPSLSDLCQNSPTAGHHPAQQDQQPGSRQAAPLPGLESHSEPARRGGDQAGGGEQPGADDGEVR